VAKPKRVRIPAAISACVAIAVALAACGGSSSSSTSTANQSTTSTVASTPSTSAASSSTGTTTNATTSTSSTPAGTPCRAADLALTVLGQQGATGHGELGFALRNTSTHTCDTVGYPGILFLDRGGAPLPTVPTHTTHDFFGVAPVTALAVAPGASVSFRLGVTHGISSPAGCTTAYGLQAIPPNDTGTLHTTIPQGAYECRTATVSPLRPGDSAYP
jgi:hypothetical protein